MSTRIKRIVVLIMSAVILAATMLMTSACYDGSDAPGAAEKAMDVNTEDVTQAKQNSELISGHNSAGQIQQPQTAVSEVQITEQLAEQAPKSQTYESFPTEGTTTADADVYEPNIIYKEEAWSYNAPEVECAASPSGYHSWLEICEWYDGDELINVGTEPAAGSYTSSSYLYSQCEYCGETK